MTRHCVLYFSLVSKLVYLSGTFGLGKTVEYVVCYIYGMDVARTIFFNNLSRFIYLSFTNEILASCHLFRLLFGRRRRS